MSEISGDELAAIAAALNFVKQSEEQPLGQPASEWKLAARREAVMTFDERVPFDRLRVTT